MYLGENEKFVIIGYSFGCTMALQIAAFLEAEKRSGSLILLDGSPAFSKQLLLEQMPDLVDAKIEAYACCLILQTSMPLQEVLLLKVKIVKF